MSQSPYTATRGSEVPPAGRHDAKPSFAEACMNRRSALAGMILAFLTCIPCLRADDWPQWRGLDRSGVSKEKGLLKQWPEKGPALVWTFRNAGFGFCSFAVVEDTLYTLGTRDKEEIVIALDVKEGKELWTAKIGPIFTFKGNTWGDGPRSTPTIDGNYLYALGGQGQLVCLDVAQKGKENWRKNLIQDFKGVMMSEWGYSESPLVDGDRLICTPGGSEGTVAALDNQTGVVLWRTKELTNKAPYSSAVVADIQGTRQYIQTSFVDDKAGGVVSGIAAKDGKVLWTMPMFSGPSYAIGPTPIVAGNTVFVTANSLNATHAFEISPDFKVTDKYPLKNQKNLKNFHGGVVLVEGHLYAHTDSLGW